MGSSAKQLVRRTIGTGRKEKISRSSKELAVADNFDQASSQLTQLVGMSSIQSIVAPVRVIGPRI